MIEQAIQLVGTKPAEQVSNLTEQALESELDTELYMSFSTTPGDSLRAEINTTPMIDVLLVLIIVFMIVVSTSTKEGLDAQIPQTSDARQRDEDAIVIQVLSAEHDRIPALKINNEAVSWDGLHDRLANIFKLRPEHVAYVKGAGDVDFQYVADAMSIERNSGVEKIGLLSDILQ